MFFQKVLKYLFFLFFVRPYILFVLGVNVNDANNLPKISKGASIIVANHNSHIDTLLLMSLFSCYQNLKIHPVVAHDYFCNTKFKNFIFKTFFGVIPIKRKFHKITKEEMFKEINETLQKGETIIIYPEGTRGEDNSVKEFKTGVAHIAKMNPNVPVVPFYINGPDRILPKGAIFWVPFIANVYISEHLYYDNTSTKEFSEKIRSVIQTLKDEHKQKEEL